MYCKNCGVLNNEVNKFCVNCGAELMKSTYENQSNINSSSFSTDINNNEKHNINSNEDLSKSSKSKINKFAIYSVISGTISIFIFWWLAFAGIGYAIKALKDVNTTGEKGKILAIVGIIVSVISLTLYFGFRAKLI